MVPSPPTTWVNFYGQNREDNGAFQKLADTDLGAFATRTRTHTGSALNFTESIAGSAHGNMLIVPGQAGRVQFLHHGFTCSTESGMATIFAQGNLSDCSYFKILPRDKSIEQARIVTGSTARTANCPTLDDMLGASSEEAFKDLPSRGNVILRNFPNHLLVNTDVFILADGASSASAKALAFAIISWFNGNPDDSDPDDDVTEEKSELAKGAETLLAFLWASENERLTPIVLDDVVDDPVLNQVIRGLKGKLTGGTPGVALTGDPGVTDHAQAAAFVLSSQSIVTELNRMHEDRTKEQSLRESKTSLLKTIDPVQKALFTNLATTDLSIPPAMSPFMITLTKSATPQKAIGLLKNRALDWEGTFSEGCCHRLLANGFLSLETNKANPGGFTVFMFHPRTVDMGTRTFDSNTATLREYFGMDVEDSTVAYYAKQGFFHPTNSHDLRIQLQTALDMLELLTCTNSIATSGLHYLLHPPRWRRYATEIHDRFVAEKSFGTKFLYSVDRTLQTFFRRLSRMSDTDTTIEGPPNFLLDHAVELINKLESGSSLAVSLPASLLSRTRTEGTPGSPAKKAKITSTVAATPAPAKRPALRHHSEEHVNANPHPTWQVPKGIDFLDLFPDRTPGSRNWPKVQDPRLPKKNRLPKSAPLCARFQMTNKCTHGCQLAHVFAKNLTLGEFNQADRLMKEALAPKAP